MQLDFLHIFVITSTKITELNYKYASGSRYILIIFCYFGVLLNWSKYNDILLYFQLVLLAIINKLNIHTLIAFSSVNELTGILTLLTRCHVLAVDLTVRILDLFFC